MPMMDYWASIQNFAGSIKDTGWPAMRETVISFVRYAIETVLSLEQEKQLGCGEHEPRCADFLYPGADI